MFSLQRWLTKRRTNLEPKITLDFHCLNCKQRFKYKVRRMYIELNTLDQRQGDGPRPKQSEFIVAERVTCPRCQTVDRYRIGPSVHQYLTTTPLIASHGIPLPGNPIQCIRYTLLDGRPMHPLDALEYYAAAVDSNPADNDLRLAYAKTLRMLGYHNKAETQYLAALKTNELEPEALLNLAVINGKREDREAAIKYLLELIETEEYSRHPEQSLFVEAAQQIADGVVRMDEIELTAPALFNLDGAPAVIARLHAKSITQKKLFD